MTTPALTPIDDPANWLGPDLEADQSWLFVLTPTEITSLQEMAAQLRPRLNGDANTLLSLQRHDFDLGDFAPTLARVYDTLRSGLGVVLLRGLPIDTIPLLDVATIYWGIGLHLGTATPNNPEGDMFGHITDLGKTQKDANSRGYQTRELMDYHCDQCDIVGLLCLRTAKSGGTSMLTSSVAMYNTLLAKYPQHAEALTQPLFWSKMGEHGPQEDPFYQSPVFNFTDGQICTSFGPKHIEKGHALPGVPDLSPLQRAAIRTSEQIAHDQRFEMTLERGDMQFANNYVTLHTRSAYIDHAAADQKRLLWRLWLMNDDLRPRTGYSAQFQKGVALGTKRTQIRV